jgi:hypothetical protein
MLRLVCTTLILSAILIGGLNAQECQPRPNATQLSEIERQSLDWFAIFPNQSVALYRRMTGLGVPTALHEGRLYTVPGRRWTDLLRKIGAPADALRGGLWSCNLEFASDILEERVNLLGPDHPYIRDWLQNQLTVFKNCGQPARAPQLPEVQSAYEPAVQAMAAADFQYQMAAAHFYFEYSNRQSANWHLGAENFQEALSTFTEIANDSTSRYRAIAIYMIARIHADGRDYEAALTRIEAILADPTLTQVHAITRQLRNFVAYHSQAHDALVAQLAEIAQVLSVPLPTLEADDALQRHYADALIDLDWFVRGPGSEEALADAAKDSPILAWVRLMRDSRRYYPGHNANWLLADPAELNDAYDRETEAAIARWHRGDGLHWAVVAIARLYPGHPQQTSLMAMVDELTPKFKTCAATDAEGLAYLGTLYHAIRLSMTGGQVERGFELIGGHPPRTSPFIYTAVAESLSWMIGTRNLAAAHKLNEIIADMPPSFYVPVPVHGMRLLMSQDRDSFLKIVGAAQERRRSARLFETEAATLNVLPVRDLALIVDSPHLRAETRAAIARVAWTRAYLLGDDSMVRSLTPKLRALNPALAPYLDGIDGAWTARHRDHLVLRMLATHPRLGIRINAWIDNVYEPAPTLLSKIDSANPNDNNWWCAFDEDSYRGEFQRRLYDDIVGLSMTPRQKRFDRGRAELLRTNGAITLSEHWISRRIDARELKALAVVPSAPRYLSEGAIAWARSTDRVDRWLGRDEHLAETLHLAIRSTRWGCRRDGGHRDYSRQAFVALHTQYKDSAWATRSKYWYDCQHFRYLAKGETCRDPMPRR